MAEASVADSPTCPLCGREEFLWGRLVTQDGAFQDGMAFRPDGPFFTVVSTNERVRVRKCEGCGNLQLFSEG